MTNDVGPTTDQLTRIRSNILTTIASRQKNKRRRVLAIGVLAVAAIGTSAAAIAVTQASNDQANTSFDCYSVADLRADHGTTGRVDDDRNAFTLLPLSERVAVAIETCQAGWRAVPTEPYPGSGPIDVPNPTACILADGRLGVFPNEDNAPEDTFCNDLGVNAPGS